jgi:hypothetical protein
MHRVEFSEILGLGEYEAIRERFRGRIIEEKKLRRVRLGERASCVFENHDTALYQIQEMLRTERITKKSSIEHEIATYNELVPGDDELSATVMIEIDDKDERDSFLSRGLGMEKHVRLEIDGERVPAKWDPERIHEDHLSAVLYLKFPLGKALADRLRTKGAQSVVLAVDHPAYEAKVDLPPNVVVSLAGDLE